MKNVKSTVKLRRLIKSLAVSFFILIMFVAGSAFTSVYNNGDPKKPVKDSLFNDKSGFKSLFSGSRYDPARPYVAQLNPKALAFVQNYIREEGANLERMKIWGKPYLDMFDVILLQYHLPVELKYLAVIESSLVSNSISRSGAVGPWQIMPGEARRMGLRVGGKKDERKDFFKSTTAAARILKELHHQFKDWILVVAAYNCGQGRLRQAIRKSGSKNFWDLQAYLPAETRAHVKRFIGTHYVFEGMGGLTTMTAAEIHNFDLKEAIEKTKLSHAKHPGNDVVKVSGKYKSSVIAKKLGIDLSVFNKLNPNFDREVASGETYNMSLPKDKAGDFKNNKHAILSESIEALLNS